MIALLSQRHAGGPLLRLACLLLVLALSACGGLQTQPSESRRAFLGNGQLTHWQLRGKIGIVADGSAQSGYLNWRQCDDRFDIRINGPLGSGAARLQGGRDGATLFRSGEPPVSAASAEQLLQQQLQVSLPITQLRFWIRGIPSPDRSLRETATGFTQSGWSLSFPQQTPVAGFDLPARAIARSPAARVTLIVQQWNLDPDCSATP